MSRWMLALAGGCVLCGCSVSSVQPPVVLDVAYDLHCGHGPGVVLAEQGQQLLVALGSRPNPGHQLLINASMNSDGEVSVHYSEQLPQPGMMQAQVMTSPCGRVALPAQWTSMTVVDDVSGANWQFFH